MRMDFLLKFSKAFSKVHMSVSIDDTSNVGTVSYYHFNNRNMILPSMLNRIIDKILTGIVTGSIAYVKVNRRKAFEF